MKTIIEHAVGYGNHEECEEVIFLTGSIDLIGTNSSKDVRIGGLVKKETLTYPTDPDEYILITLLKKLSTLQRVSRLRLWFKIVHLPDFLIFNHYERQKYR